MCNFEENAINLCNQVDRDANGNHVLRDKCLKGISKYLLVKKLYAIYTDNTYQEDNFDIFESFFGVFGNFYDLREILRSPRFNQQNLRELLHDGIDQNNYAEALKFCLDKLAIAPQERERKTIQIVFASKALHTFNNGLPIVDRFIRKFFELSFYNNGSYEDRRDNALNKYGILVGYYQNRMNNGLNRLKEKFDEITINNNQQEKENIIGIIREEAKRVIRKYCRNLRQEIKEDLLAYIDINNINQITDIKKIDFIIWTYYR